MSEPVDERTGEMNYELGIMLDAEDLAELGVAAAYADLAPHLAELGVTPGSVTESIDRHTGEYAVSFGPDMFGIFGDAIDHRNSWGLATFALFEIVNRQLDHLETKFFAINGGNDLSGIFMTAAQAERACRALPSKRDWPYLPTAEPDWFGMSHD